MEKHPEQPRYITGVFCVFVDSYPQDHRRWHDEVKARCESLGLDFAYGLRHSHKSFDEFQQPMDPRWQQETVGMLRGSKNDQLIIDMEPYYEAKTGEPRYHKLADAPRLNAATNPWKALGELNLYVYPMGPRYHHGLAVVRQALRGGSTVFALDHTTYNPYRHENLNQYMRGQQQFSKANDMQYMPGFYLAVLKDPLVMLEASAYGRCWLYARTSKGHPDDLPHFGTPQWRPMLPERPALKRKKN